jgi:RNA polymerase sigma-70 factor (ECF subfamily)
MWTARSWPSTRVTMLRRLRDSTDTLTWGTFAELYSPLIYAYCRRRGLQDADSHDVTQSVLSQVSVGIKDFEYEPHRGLFRSWLGTITHRAILKHLWKYQSRQLWEESCSCEQPLGKQQSVDGEWVDLFNAYIYEQAIKQIRDEYEGDVWYAFFETYNRDRPPADIALELDRSIGWVYQAKFKVIRRLKEVILLLASDTNLFSG